MADIKTLIVKSQNILDPTLSGYHCELDEEETQCQGTDIPCYAQGKFCYSFRLIKGNDFKCFRIWISPTIVTSYNLDERLSKISSFLKANKREIPYFVDFEYIPRALYNSDTSTYPGIRMDWINGRTLGEYLKKGHQGSSRPASREDIARLGNDFLKMCTTFKRYNIAHGDLSSRNILIDQNGNIRLVDYDSIYVPSLGSKAIQATYGAPGFQHHKRLNPATDLYASPKDDNFSQQIIYLSLLAIANSAKIYDARENLIDNELLFSGIDLESVTAFEKSKAYKLIKDEFAPTSPERKLLDELSKSIAGPLSEVKSIVDIIVQAPQVHNTHQTKAENPHTSSSKPKNLSPEAFEEAMTLVHHEYPGLSDNVIRQIVTKVMHRPMTQEEEKIWEKVKIDMRSNGSIQQAPASEPPKATPVPKLSEFCHKCGRKYTNETDKFCIKCGTKRLEKINK